MSESATSESFLTPQEPVAEVGPDEASGIAEEFMNIYVDAVFFADQMSHHISVTGISNCRSLVGLKRVECGNPAICVIVLVTRAATPEPLARQIETTQAIDIPRVQSFRRVVILSDDDGILDVADVRVAHE